jgi:hypothetical protein
MHTRIVALAATAATAAVLTAAAPAQAKTVESFDRRAFDGTPVVTASGWSLSAPTAGELGGWLDMTVTAADGTKPSNGTCELATVDAVLTVAPGESFTIRTTGELCAHFTDGTPSLFGSFGAKQMSYSGSHKKAKLVGEGFVSFGHSFLGAQGAVTLSVRH